MDKSWFSKASASKYGLLSPSNTGHDLPRWRSPSPMAASMIPPPIVQSTYPVSPKLVAKPPAIEFASPLQDRQSELEADLQFLLDAQAEGLVRGLQGGSQDDRASTGSTTPTAQSVRSASAKRSSRPVRRKIGLKSARKGIHNSMLALSAVQDEELQGFDEEVRERDVALARMDDWDHKREGLQEATRHVDESEEMVRAQRLRQGADALQQEINNVELQLEDMKSRHRKLLRQVAAVENSVQAKLASYTSSLSMLEADVHKFLSREPARSSSRPASREDGKTSIWQLPPKQRTLDMAREEWRHEREDALQQGQSVAHEKAALDEGASMWKNAVAQITEFEKKLKEEMSTLNSMSSSQSAWEDPPSPQNETPQERLRQLLQQLDVVLHDLEAKHEVAEQRDWKLLIAAIGAEVDALRQGKQILEGVLKVGEDHHQQNLVDTHEQTGQSPSSDMGNGDAIHSLDESFATTRPPVARRHTSDSEDDPDPELLFSRQDLEQD